MAERASEVERRPASVWGPARIKIIATLVAGVALGVGLGLARYFGPSKSGAPLALDLVFGVLFMVGFTIFFVVGWGVMRSLYRQIRTERGIDRASHERLLTPQSGRIRRRWRNGLPR